MNDLDQLKATMKVTRVPAENADDVRARDEAEIDGQFYPDGRRVGDPVGRGAYSDQGTATQDGGALRRRPRTAEDGNA